MAKENESSSNPKDKWAEWAEELDQGSDWGDIYDNYNKNRE